MGWIPEREEGVKVVVILSGYGITYTYILHTYYLIVHWPVGLKKA